MTLQEKHILEKNKRAFILGMVIMFLAALLLGSAFISTKTGIHPRFIIRQIIFAILTVLYVVFFIKHRHSKKFMYSGGIVLMVSYVVLIFMSESSYMYAYVFAVAVYIMFYQDYKFTTIFNSIACALNVILCVKYCVTQAGDVISNIVQMCFAVSTCIIITNVVSILERH